MKASYLRFVDVSPPGRKTGVWDVRSASSNDPLGYVRWWGSWRQYVFEPEPNTIWSTGCMADVEAFIKAQMAARLRERAG